MFPERTFYKKGEFSLAYFTVYCIRSSMRASKSLLLMVSIRSLKNIINDSTS